MRVSITVEADYDNLDDREALTPKRLTDELTMIAKIIDQDYRGHHGEHEKYGTFFQVYNIKAGSKPSYLRNDGVANEIVKQTEMKFGGTND
jgi:hypothetical protein